MFNSGDGNADNIAESIDERSTTIAAGNRNIGLNMPEAGFGILSPRTDNSLGNRRRQAQGWGCRSRTLLRVVGFGLSYRQDATRTDRDFTDTTSRMASRRNTSPGASSPLAKMTWTRFACLTTCWFASKYPDPPMMNSETWPCPDRPITTHAITSDVRRRIGSLDVIARGKLSRCCLVGHPISCGSAGAALTSDFFSRIRTNAFSARKFRSPQQMPRIIAHI